MNITFTKEELAKFASELETWYGRKLLFIVEHLGRNLSGIFPDPVPLIKIASEEFERVNQKPDWRNHL